MLASFSVVPMGTGEGVEEIVAEAISIVDGSGLPYQLGPCKPLLRASPNRCST